MIFQKTFCKKNLRRFALWRILNVPMKSRFLSSLGFTMIELLVAATILAVISGIALVSFTSANVRVRDGKRKGDLEQARSALELYRSDVGTYPNGSWDTMVTTISTAGYLSSTTIRDPKNINPYVYQYTYDANTKTYQVCAYLESTSTPGSYCLQSP